MRVEVAGQVMEIVAKATVTFDTAAKGVQQLARDSNNELSISFFLYSILQDVNEHQRLLLYYVIAELNIGRVGNLNGFCTPLLDAAERVNSVRDSYFIWQLLSRPGVFRAEIKDSVPLVVARRLEAMFSQESTSAHRVQETAAGLKALRFESKLQATSSDALQQVAVPPFLSVREAGAPGVQWTTDSLRSAVDLHNGYIQGGGLNNLRPHFIQLPPPLMELSEEELQWDDAYTADAYTADAACLLWDTSACSDLSVLDAGQASVVALLESAPYRVLTPKQQAEVTAYISSHPEVAVSSGLSPASVRGLVEHNWSLCVAFLRCATGLPAYTATAPAAPSPTAAAAEGTVEDYLAPLLELGPSVHCVEVVSALGEQVRLPVAFVRQYALRFMAACERAPDKSTQGRTARLVCLLLQGLLARYPTALQPLLVEVQTFCLTFSGVKEAAALYRTITASEGAAGKR